MSILGSVHTKNEVPKRLFYPPQYAQVVKIGTINSFETNSTMSIPHFFRLFKDDFHFDALTMCVCRKHSVHLTLPWTSDG